MRRLIFDCETNGLYYSATRCWSLVMKDPDTGDVISCADQPGYVPIKEGVRLLTEADVIIGHNIIAFDVPTLDKLYDFKPKGEVIDTLVCSRLIWSDIGDLDDKLIRRNILPSKFRGQHGLRAWGYRLNKLKGDYGQDEEDAWAAWSREMQDYCELDVEVTHELFKRIISKDYSQQALSLEHEFATIIGMMSRNGFGFDREAAHSLYAELVTKRLELVRNLKEAFRPWYVAKGEFTPKRNNAKIGYVAGCPLTKIELTEFNPSSRAHIADRLKKLHGWVPTEVNEASGQPKLDETVLSKLPWPEAKLLAEHFLIEKRIGQLAEGKQAWLRLELDGIIHGSVNTNGAVTGRCTHSYPNVAQVPSVGAPYGTQCRAMFRPTRRGWVQVGADASGLELRCLAHYMARYDGGIYARILLEGDIHWANVQAMGLTDEERDDNNKVHKTFRNGAKTFCYGFLYGCGDEKAGRIVFDIILKLKALGLPFDTTLRHFFKGNVNPGEEDFKAAGKKLKKQFLEKTPALKRLIEDVQGAVKKRGHLKGIDGRFLHVRSQHAALNTLLQSAGALVVKYATILIYREAHARGFVWGRDWALMAHVHDEVQMECKPEIADELGRLAVECIRRAGEHFSFRCPLDGEYKTGSNWAACH